MDGSGFQYWSQSRSVATASGFPFPAAGSDEEAAVNPGNPSLVNHPPIPRSHLENLDLNSQVDSFTSLLHSDGVSAGSTLPSFLPPRQLQFGGGEGGRTGGTEPGRGHGGLADHSRGGLADRRRGGPKVPGRGRGSRSLPPSNGAGNSGSTPPLRGRPPKRPVARPTTNAEEDGDDDGDENSSVYDKANWNERNTHIFCDLALEQSRAGNCPKLQMKSYAYKEIAEKFRSATGLWHSTKQLRNRFTQCKVMYNWLKDHLKDTGLGLTDGGGLDAQSDDWWKKECQGKNSECKKFKWGLPQYMDQLHEMFHGTTVDGSTSCVPGSEGWGKEPAAEQPAAEEEDDEEEEEEDLRTPKSGDGRKRGGTTTDTASSPKKKSKSPMIKCINNLINTLQVGSSKEVLVAKQIQQEIRKGKLEEKKQEEERKQQDTNDSLAKVRGLGMTEDSEEFYVALRMFEHDYHRKAFNNLTTDSGRIALLKRWVRD